LSRRTALRSIHTSLKVSINSISNIFFEIYNYCCIDLEGTLVVKKDKYAEKHSDDLNLPNLEVMCLLRSFASKGYVKEVFNWQYYYYYLTNEGIEYLREFLALPAEIVPATLKKAAVAAVPSGRPERGEKGKSAGPGGEFNPDFQKKDGYRS
jgi:small subunit ribosomal protein S10e